MLLGSVRPPGRNPGDTRAHAGYQPYSPSPGGYVLNGLTARSFLPRAASDGVISDQFGNAAHDLDHFVDVAQRGQQGGGRQGRSGLTRGGSPFRRACIGKVHAARLERRGQLRGVTRTAAGGLKQHLVIRGDLAHG